MSKTMKSEKQSLVPQLRFPEFSGDWEYKELSKFLKSYSEKVDAAENKFPVYSSTRDGLRFQRDYYDGREIVNEGEYGVVPKGYFVYRHMSDDTIFKFNLNDTDGKIAVSKEYPVFKTVGLNSHFLLHKLNGSLEFKKLAESQRKGGTRTRLYFNTLCSWKNLLPGLQEQQKIADCLSSLDALIAAQADKVEALKTHKKGLMQQLFPRDGETVPRLRFPEFRDVGEWKVGTIGDVADVSSGGTPNRSEAEYWNGDIPWVSTSLIDFGTIEFANEYITREGLDNSSAKVVPKGTVLMAMYGQGKTRGKVAVLGIDAAINQACAAISAKDAVLSEFVFHNLAGRYDEIRKISNAGGQENLSGTLIKSISFKYPSIESGEQQRIADCLSSLDALIAAHTEKLDALKAHKKGLMQQLFPSPEAVSV